MNGQIRVYLFKSKTHDSIHSLFSKHSLLLIFKWPLLNAIFSLPLFFIWPLLDVIFPLVLFSMWPLWNTIYLLIFFYVTSFLHCVFATFQTLGSRFGLATVVLFLSGSHSQRVSRFTNLSGFGKGKWVISKDLIDCSADLSLL